VTKQQRVAEAEASVFQQVREGVYKLEALHLVKAWTEVVTAKGQERSPLEACWVLIRLADYIPGAICRGAVLEEILSSLLGAAGQGDDAALLVVRDFFKVLRDSQMLVCSTLATNIVDLYVLQNLPWDVNATPFGVDVDVARRGLPAPNQFISILAIVDALSARCLAEKCLSAPISRCVGAQSNDESRRFWENTAELFGPRSNKVQIAAISTVHGDSFADAILRCSPGADPVMLQNVIRATNKHTAEALRTLLVGREIIDPLPVPTWGGVPKDDQWGLLGRWREIADRVGNDTVMQHFGQFLGFLDAVEHAADPRALRSLLSENAEWLCVFNTIFPTRLIASDPRVLCRWAVISDVLFNFVGKASSAPGSNVRSVDPIEVAKALRFPDKEIALLIQLSGWLGGYRFNMLGMLGRRRSYFGTELAKVYGEDCLAVRWLLGKSPRLLLAPNSHLDTARQAYRDEFGEIGLAELKEEELTAFFRDSSPENWLGYLGRHIPDDPPAQMNFFAAAVAAAQRGPAAGTAPQWWPRAARTAPTLARLLWDLRNDNRNVRAELAKWLPTNEENAAKALSYLPKLTLAALRLLRLIVHWGGYQHKDGEVPRFSTLTLMDEHKSVLQYYDAVYNGHGLLLPRQGSIHSEDDASFARDMVYPNGSYRADLRSWLRSFAASSGNAPRLFVPFDAPAAEDVLYAEGISPIEVEYWGLTTKVRFYDHKRIHDKGHVKSLTFSNYPFLADLNLDDDGYINLAEIFVDGVVTNLPQGASDGRIRVIHGVRPGAPFSWLGCPSTTSIHAHSPLGVAASGPRYDVSRFLTSASGTANVSARAAYVPVLTSAGYNALMAWLRDVRPPFLGDYNKASESGFTIFPRKYHPGESVFTQLDEGGRRFELLPSILSEPTVMDVADGVRDHLSGFVVRNLFETCPNKPHELIISQDLVVQNPLALQYFTEFREVLPPHYFTESRELVPPQLLLLETLNNRLALDYLAIHVEKKTICELLGADCTEFSEVFNSTLVQFGTSKIVNIPDSFEEVRLKMELSPGVVRCVDCAKNIAAAAVAAAAEPAVPDVSWGDAMRSASAAGLGIGRHEVFPPALVAYVADKIKNEFPDQLNETCQWWLASQVAVALGSSNYAANEKFGDDVVECIKDDFWFDRAVG
jgi:hypothetical protein